MVALAGFVLVRASQDPTLNWGDATNLSRLAGLVRCSDFAGVGTAGAPGPGGAVSVFAGLVRDFGLGAIAFSLVGIVAWRRLRRDQALFLAVAGLGNVAALIAGATLPRVDGFVSVIVNGGYLLLTMIVIALLVAHGASSAIEWMSAEIAARGTATGLPKGVAAVAAVVTRPW